MFCRHCGKEVADKAIMCVSCGVPPRRGKNFCQSCGEPSAEEAVVCIKCGLRLTGEGKDWLTTLLLAIFLGLLGVHRFYTGHILIGIVQLLTFGGFGIWVLIDIILIIAENFNDKEGNPLVKH